MQKRTSPRLVPVVFGYLPVRAINDALSLELDEGKAYISLNALRHAQRRHPEEFAVTFPHVAAVVVNPLYVRDDFKNAGKIELVGRPEGLKDFLLVAVEVTLDADGRYSVTSFYPISETKVAGRRDSGHLKRLRLL